MTVHPDHLKRQVVSSIAWASATRMAGQMLNWVMTLVVIRFLSPADYGLMALVTALTGFLQALTSTGFADALVQAREVDETVWRRTFGLILTISAGLAALLCVAAYPLADLYDQPRLIALLQIASLSFLIMAPAAVSRARLDRDLAFKHTARVDMVANVLAGLVVLALAWRGFGVWALMAGMLAGMAITAAAMWWLAPFRRWPSFSLGGMRAILHFGAYRTAEHMAWYVSTQIDIFMVGKLLGEHVLGVYSVSKTIAAMPVSKFGTIIKPIGSSAFARLQDDRARALSYLMKTIGVLSFLSFPLFFGMAAVAPELVEVVLGPHWTEATLPLGIVALGMAIVPPGLVLSPFLMALGHVRASFMNTMASLGISAAAYAIGSLWGLLGVCVAGTLSYPLKHLILVRRIAGVTEATTLRLFAPMLRPLICAVLMVLAVLAVRGLAGSGIGGAARLGLLVSAGAVVYAAAGLTLCRDILSDLLALVPRGASVASVLRLRV